MDTSPAVIVLVSAAVASVCAAFLFQIRLQRAARSLERWVVEKHPDLWKQLPWVQRKLVAQAGLDLLRKGTLKHDGEFLTLYRQVSYWKQRMLVALLLGSAFIALTIV